MELSRMPCCYLTNSLYAFFPLSSFVLSGPLSFRVDDLLLIMFIVEAFLHHCSWERFLTNLYVEFVA